MHYICSLPVYHVVIMRVGNTLISKRVFYKMLEKLSKIADY